MELIEAINDNDIDLVIELLNKGVDVNYQDVFGESPLIAASLQGNKKIVDILLNAGADVNLTDNIGNNALIYAIPLQYGRYYNKNQLIVRTLLEHGINPLHKNDDGESAYDIAMNFGHRSAYDILEHYMDIYRAYSRIQALQRGKRTRRKLRTSMARRRSALSRLGYTHGVSDDIIEMINHMSIPSRFDMTRPSHIDMIDETPYNM